MTMLSIARWNPYREMASLENRLNRLFNEAGGPFASTEGVGPWLPPVDVVEEQDRLVFRAEIPGVAKDDIDVKVENGTLILRGEKKQEKEIETQTAHRVERFYGTFSRSFVLPTSINADGIQARYKDGVLEIVLPKTAEAKPRKISILTA
jgi:HSP20 family protein